MKQNPTRRCRACGATLTRKRFSGRLEDNSRFLVRQTCGQKCMARWMMKPDDQVSRSGMLGRARKHLGPECELCGAKSMLSIHHLNRNWRDNRPRNLQTLCSSCHTSLHHAAGDIAPRRPKKRCHLCEAPSRKHGLCGAHAQRLRAYGDPLLVKRNVDGSWQLVIDVNVSGSGRPTRINSTCSATASCRSKRRSHSSSSGSDSPRTSRAAPWNDEP